ncbi:hypothetical protein TNCV_3858411 [Trichonephila clavipes]|nr:hypothetical protein TNCV_3858411 [Trichonephila clavipes]
MPVMIRYLYHWATAALFDVSEKAKKVSKATNSLDVRRLPAPLKASKKLLRRWYKQQQQHFRNVEALFLNMSLSIEIQ